MAEKDLWATARDRLKLHGHFERIENMVGVGRPDVNYCVRGVEGNIELKQLPRWPVRAETVVDIPHYTAAQRLWARQRLSAGGRVYVLLGIVRPVRQYLLLNAAWSRQHLGIDAVRQTIELAAIVDASGAFPTEQLLRALTGPFTFP